MIICKKPENQPNVQVIRIMQNTKNTVLNMNSDQEKLL